MLALLRVQYPGRCRAADLLQCHASGGWQNGDAADLSKVGLFFLHSIWCMSRESSGPEVWVAAWGGIDSPTQQRLTSAAVPG